MDEASQYHPFWGVGYNFEEVVFVSEFTGSDTPGEEKIFICSSRISMRLNI